MAPRSTSSAACSTRSPRPESTTCSRCAATRRAGRPSGRPHPEGLHYSTELVDLIRERYPLAIGAACFPEIHPQAPDLAHDLRFLKEKVDAGASFLITQLFFDNELYFNFVDEARAVGIDVPILPGIMPITDVKQIKTITGLCGATIPPALLDALEDRAEDRDAVLELGVSYATLQCAELLARGAPGIHFCTLNRSPATRAILSALKLLKPWVRREVVRTWPIRWRELVWEFRPHRAAPHRPRRETPGMRWRVMVLCVSYPPRPGRRHSTPSRRAG